jgi:hypothetical protein
MAVIQLEHMEEVKKIHEYLQKNAGTGKEKLQGDNKELIPKELVQKANENVLKAQEFLERRFKEDEDRKVSELIVEQLIIVQQSELESAIEAGTEKTDSSAIKAGNK